MHAALLTILVICLIIDIVLVLFMVSRSDSRRTYHFGILCILLTIYTLGYIAELQAVTVEGARIALLVENFAIPSIAPFYVIALLSLFYPERVHMWQTVAAIVYGSLVFFSVATNAQHHLYYATLEMLEINGEYFLSVTRGPIAMLHQVIAFALLLLGHVLLLVRFFKGSNKIKRRMIFFLIGSSVSFLANILHAVKALSVVIDPTPIALTIGLLVFGISLVFDDLADVVIRARDTSLETMDDALIVLDSDGDFLYCNSSAKTFIPELDKLKESDSIEKLKTWPSELLELNGEKNVKFVKVEDGITRHYSARTRRIYRRWRAKNIGVSIVIHDITETTELVMRLEELATTDSLTNIYNRRSMLEMMERTLAMFEREKKPCAIIGFDIDHFKQVNDIYGHAAGDKTLINVVETVKRELRSYDIFGRIGGEEFLIFSTMSGKDAIISFAERLRRAIEKESIEFDGHIISVTASFGMVEMLPGTDIHEMLKLADSAMYYAKRNGRNMVHFCDKGTALAVK